MLVGRFVAVAADATIVDLVRVIRVVTMATCEFGPVGFVFGALT